MQESENSDKTESVEFKIWTLEKQYGIIVSEEWDSGFNATGGKYG